VKRGEEEERRKKKEKEEEEEESKLGLRSCENLANSQIREKKKEKQQ
jgi:hypothetical protein